MEGAGRLRRPERRLRHPRRPRRPCTLVDARTGDRGEGSRVGIEDCRRRNGAVKGAALPESRRTVSFTPASRMHYSHNVWSDVLCPVNRDRICYPWVTMSALNGDKARFNRERKAKL